MGAVRRHDPEASRAAILNAAEGLFLERGFAGASMSSIAKSSGVTKSLIHHHFGSKEALWDEVKRTRFQHYYNQQMQMLSQDAPSMELLRDSMFVYFKFLKDNPKQLRLTWWMWLEGTMLCGDDEMMTELRKTAIRRISLLQEQGGLRADVKPEFVLMTFLGVIHGGFTEDWVCADVEFGADEYIRDVWKMFEHGVTPRPRPQ